MPPDPQATAALPRPMRPAGRQPRVRPHAAQPRWSFAWVVRTLGLRRGYGIVAIAAVLCAIGIWQWKRYASQTPQSNRLETLNEVDPRLVARLPPEAVRETLAPAFLGQRLAARNIAWLVDGGSGMAPYYADITTLVATAMSLMDPGTQKVGLYLASEKLADALPLVSAGPKALETARMAMRKFQATGRTDLSAPFEQVVSWKPDVIFLVLSQPTSDPVRDAMIRRARSSGITVNVAAVGEQSYFGWRSLAEETSGKFVRLDARELSLWVDRTIRPLPEGAETLRVSGSSTSAPTGQ